MRNLNEINNERNEIIENAIGRILERTGRKGTYSAEELSKLTDGIISPEAFNSSLQRGRRELMRFRISNYHLYGILPCTIEVDYKTITYKGYDENGELVHTYKRRVKVLKATLR